MLNVITKFVPNFATLIEFHKANMEALIESQASCVRATQEISKEIIEQTKSNLETVITTGKSALAAKTIQEAFQLNVSGLQTGYEKFVGGSTRISEVGFKLATDAFAPIKTRVSAVASSMQNAKTA